MGKNSGVVFLGMGFELVAISVGGYFFGQYIDDYMGWQARASVYLVLLLMVGWFVHLFYLIQKFEKDNKDNEYTDPQP